MLAVLARIAAAAAVLLLVSGFAKLRTPDAAATMVGGLVPRIRRHRRAVRFAVRLGGAVEVCVGAAFLVTGSRWSAALLASAYLLFVGVALVLVKRGATGTSCGCFGSASSPVGLPHVLLTAVALAAAAATCARPTGAFGGVFTAASTDAIVGALQIGLLAWLGYLSITALPALAAARRPEEAR